ncbi:hypothetical protein EJ07DRAFT_182604 [Lizonia empirigonia]|nr:hypothetical protein EJ07DRAFT_182604 [Lizonia empirigonia]
MSRSRRILRLPSAEDVVELLEAASVAADKQYDGPGYSLQAPVIPASKRCVRKQGGSHDKLYDAPSPEHDFPEGNITLAEIAAFIPQSIKCWDVVDRILWNGAKTQDITNLINKYRLMPAGEIFNNTVYLMMRGQMDKRSKEDARYEGWTVGLHQAIEKPDNFDSDSISITGFRRPIIFRNCSGLPAQPVLFKDLAKGVAVWPQHGDALDLTRCVAWCVANPDEELYYPTDFQKVLHEFLGGPIPPRACHTDAEVLLRIRSDKGAIKPRCRAKVNYEKDETEKSRSDRDAGTQFGMLKRKRSTSWSCKSNDRFEKPLSKLPRSIHALRKSNSLGPSRKSLFHFRDHGSNDDTNDEYQGPKRAKKNKAAPRRSERKTTRISYAYEAMEIDDDELYSKEEEKDGKIPGLGDEEADRDVDEMDEDKNQY